MEQSPENKMPTSSMPQATDAPDNIDIAENLPLVTSTAAQWEIDVVAEPSG